VSRFLIYAGAGHGHVYPLAATADALRRRGHQVVLRAGRGGVETLRGLGFAAEPIRREVEEREDDSWQARTPLGGMRRSVAGCMDRFPYEAADVRDAVEAEQPDALLVDNLSWGASAAAEGSGLPWAQAAVFPLPLTTPDAPPFGLGLKPARGRAGRIRDAVVRSSALPMFNRLLPSVNAGRARVGVKPIEQLNDVYMTAPLVVAYTAEPLEYPREHLPASVRLVGPAVWDPGVSGDAPPWLAEIDRPIVLVTVSTLFQNDAKLIQTTLDALADEPVVVVATTASIDPSQFGVPRNARVERFVPHSLVLPRATCVVCHGGSGITGKALMEGVPVCVVPFARDQFEIARRIEVAGAGARLPAARLKAGRLRRAVERARGCRGGAERAGQLLRAAGGAEAAADALEGLPVARADVPPGLRRAR